MNSRSLKFIKRLSSNDYGDISELMNRNIGKSLNIIGDTILSIYAVPMGDKFTRWLIWGLNEEMFSGRSLINPYQGFRPPNLGANGEFCK